MSSPSFYEELVAATGSEETAQKVINLFDRTQQTVKLTDAQRTVLEYLESGKPIMSQRQLAKDTGFDHPQKLVSTLAALVVKGYLVPRSQR